VADLKQILAVHDLDAYDGIPRRPARLIHVPDRETVERPEALNRLSAAPSTLCRLTVKPPEGPFSHPFGREPHK